MGDVRGYLEGGGKELVHVETNVVAVVSGDDVVGARGGDGRGVGDVHVVVGKVIDSDVHVTSLEDGGDVLDRVLDVEGAVVLFEERRHAGIRRRLDVLVDVDETLKVGVVVPSGRVVVVVDLDDLVGVLDGAELVAVVSETDEDGAGAVGVGNAADGTVDIRVELHDVTQQEMPRDSLSRRCSVVSKPDLLAQSDGRTAVSSHRSNESSCFGFLVSAKEKGEKESKREKERECRPHPMVEKAWPLES